MKSFKVPAGEAGDTFTEKKSRFTGNIFKVETPEQATEIIKRMQKQFWDASHNVYAYILNSGEVRFSDDGEPQGTAGRPTLDVLQKNEVSNVLCVTTRYFGGILLGAGGLVRAYSHAAKIALDAAGIAVMTPFSVVEAVCPYTYLEVVRKQYEPFEASESKVDYGEHARLELVVPHEKCDGLIAQLVEVTAGRIKPEKTGTRVFEKKL